MRGTLIYSICYFKESLNYIHEIKINIIIIIIIFYIRQFMGKQRHSNNLN